MDSLSRLQLRFSCAYPVPYRLIQRARIILLANQGLSNTVISQKVNLHRHQVRKRATKMA